MVVVKLSFTRSRGAVKAHLRYITHRPGRDNERTTRVLFVRDGKLSKDQAYGLIDAARRGTVFFRLMLSPDPRKEDLFKDLNLRDLTADALLFLQNRLGQEIHFIAAEHADHRPHRHVHLIALIQGRLTKADIQALRSFVTEAALLQRQELDMARAATRQAAFVRMAQAAPVGERVPQFPHAMQVYSRMQHARRLRYELGTTPTYPSCGPSQPMDKLPGRAVYECPRCDLHISRSSVSVPTPSQEAGWGV